MPNFRNYEERHKRAFLPRSIKSKNTSEDVLKLLYAPATGHIQNFLWCGGGVRDICSIESFVLYILDTV